MTAVPARIDADDDIRELLRDATTIALVGASPKPWRDSNGIMAMLLGAGDNVIPVNPNYAKVLGRACAPDRASVAVPIDIVSVFRRPSALLSLIEEAVHAGAPALWLQPDAVDEEAADRGARAGLRIVADRCIGVEYRRLVRAPRN